MKPAAKAISDAMNAACGSRPEKNCLAMMGASEP